MSPDQAALVSRIARRAAKTYARRFPWMSADDLEQEVWAYVLPTIESIDTTRPEAGAFVHAKAVTACKRAAWRMGAIANVPRAEASKGAVASQRASSADEEELGKLEEQAMSADQAIEQAEERLALAKLVAEHLAQDDEGAAIRAVLSGEMRSQQAADAHGLDVTRLYSLTKQAKKAIRADKRFQEFV